MIIGQVANYDASSSDFQLIYKEALSPSKEKKDTAVAKKIELPKMLYPSMAYGYYEPPKQETVLIKGATVWTCEKEGILKETDVLIQNGKIVSVGKNLTAPTGYVTIDGKNKHVSPGIIDEHSHIAISGGVNEGSQEVTAEVRIGDVINPTDINIYRQLAGGTTGAQLLHGSANPIGGQSALVKLKWGVAPEAMKIQGADGFIKCALGENVKQSNWGSRFTSRYPQTRMGVEQVFMDAFTRAREYENKLKTSPLSTRKDLELDALLEILNKKRYITCHSYVQSEINMLMHVADSFKFKINTFTHILEGYKVADKMKAHGAAGSTFADWWAYKYEVNDAIPYNATVLNKMGLTTSINSDDAEMGRRLNQEAAKTVKYGGTSEEDALKMVTINPAKMLHIDNRTGSIKAGKDADVVIWNDNPLSIYAKPEYTFVEGVLYYSIEKDKQLREQIKKERNELIQKMLSAKNGGEKTDAPKRKREILWDCEDFNFDFDYTND